MRKTITANEAMAVLRTAGLAPHFDQTGGGTGTIFVYCNPPNHAAMIGPFNYYTPDEPEPLDALSVGVETTDPDKWGDGTLGAFFNSDEELAYKVAALVTSPDPMKLTAEDLDAAYLANYGLTARERVTDENARLAARVEKLEAALGKIAAPLYLAPGLSTADRYADTRDELKDCKAIARAALADKECKHNEMVETGNPSLAWKCAKCGYVYGAALAGEE